MSDKAQRLAEYQAALRREGEEHGHALENAKFDYLMEGDIDDEPGFDWGYSWLGGS